MSKQNSAISSFFSNPNTRVSVEASINSDNPGIKFFLFTYFSNAKIFAKIQRQVSGRTHLTIQGHPSQFPSNLDRLKDYLKAEYQVDMVWNEPIRVAEENRLKSVTIEDTKEPLKRDSSSGEGKEMEFEEISFGGSANSENLKKLVKETAESLVNAAAGFFVAQGWTPQPKKEHISVKHKDRRFTLEISTIRSLDALMNAVGDKFQLPQPIKLLYFMEDDDPVVVTDVKDLREGFLYHALTVLEALPTGKSPQFSPEMEEFFERLQRTLKNEAKKKRQMDEIRAAFDKEDVEFDQLMQTGDLAMTDEKLEKMGIKKLGLRTAILSVIKSNH